MGDVLFAIVNSSGKIFRNSLRSSPRAAQTTYPSGQLRFMLHSVRSSCVECWQVSECCVTWFCSTARRVTTGSLHSTLSTSLSSHWNVSRIAATTYTSGMIDLVQRLRSTLHFTEASANAATRVYRKLLRSRFLTAWPLSPRVTTRTLSSVWMSEPHTRNGSTYRRTQRLWNPCLSP